MSPLLDDDGSARTVRSHPVVAVHARHLGPGAVVATVPLPDDDGFGACRNGNQHRKTGDQKTKLLHGISLSTTSRGGKRSSGRSELVDGMPNQLLARQLHQLLGSAIDLEDHALGADQGDGVGRLFEQRLVLVLRLRQRVEGGAQRHRQLIEARGRRRSGRAGGGYCGTFR